MIFRDKPDSFDIGFQKRPVGETNVLQSCTEDVFLLHWHPIGVDVILYIRDWVLMLRRLLGLGLNAKVNVSSNSFYPLFQMRLLCCAPD
jgi:hypothetical protein